MSGPRRAQTMVNKEEKMNNKTNLKINDDMYVEKSEWQKKMQTIVAEAKGRIHRDAVGTRVASKRQPVK